MDREAVAAGFRRLYALAQRCDPNQRSAILLALGDCACAALGPSFRFEPDMARTTDATSARMSALRPVPSAPRLSVIPGGGAERPSDRYIDDDNTPKAG